MVALSTLARSIALPHVLASSLSSLRSASHYRGRVVARAASGAEGGARTSRLEVVVVPCLTDNYGFLLHDAATGATASVDTPDAAALEAALASRGWCLTHVFNTHWHADHVGGNLALAHSFPGLEIVGPAQERAKIPGLTNAVGGGESFAWGGHHVDVLDVGGHTMGHVAYHLPSEQLVFVGDALFALGCGRLFEGTPTQAWASLSRLMALDDATRVYCAHEYTAANAAFARTVEGPAANAALAARLADVARARRRGQPTVPTTVGLERATNPFVRPAAARAALGLPAETSDAEVFATVRRMKDKF